MECPTIQESIQKIELYPTPDKICDKLRYCPKTGHYFHTPESLALQPIAPVPDSIKQMMEAEAKKIQAELDMAERHSKEADDLKKQIEKSQQEFQAERDASERRFNDYKQTMEARFEAERDTTIRRFDKLATMLQALGGSK